MLGLGSGCFATVTHEVSPHLYFVMLSLVREVARDLCGEGGLGVTCMTLHVEGCGRFVPWLSSS